MGADGGADRPGGDPAPRAFEPVIRRALAGGPGLLDVLRANAWVVGPLVLLALGGVFAARYERGVRARAREDAERPTAPSPAELRAREVEDRMREAEGLGPALEREEPRSPPASPGGVERD